MEHSDQWLHAVQPPATVHKHGLYIKAKEEPWCVLNVLLFLLGQSVFLQGWVSMATPLHALPPFWGGGLLHSRTLVMLPSPHVVVHADQGDQKPQFPPARAEKERHIKQIFFYCTYLKKATLIKKLAFNVLLLYCKNCILSHGLAFLTTRTSGNSNICQSRHADGFLTLAVTLCQCAAASLERGARARRHDAVAGPATLLPSTPAGRWAVRPFGPRRPSIFIVFVHKHKEMKDKFKFISFGDSKYIFLTENLTHQDKQDNIFHQ